MPTTEELERLVSDIESDRVERKESITDRDRIRQAICAFANDLPAHQAPGYVFIGVDDSGKPVGLPVSDQLLLTLSDMRSDGNILPLPHLTVQKVRLHGIDVAMIEVHPSDMPPVRLRGQVWIRVGPRRAIASLQEERTLAERQIAGSWSFDRRPCLDATIGDLILESFRGQYLPQVVDPQVIAENNRTVEEQLASLRFFDLKRQVPTYAGLLVFGKDPLDFMPGAFIQFVRFDGDTLADPIQDEKAVTGNLLTQLLQIDNLLPLQIRTARMPDGGLRQEDVPDYPLAAIREITFNAVMHRAYEATNAPVRINWFRARVEMQSPGGLYGQVTPQNYEHVTDYRNPVIAEAMRALGHVERFGTGIARANAALKANGNPPAEFIFEASHVLVTMRRRA
ncbi:MAG TPA: ATP-binding protein [Terriglobia bacterium]|nr:ATP-binding protein [Terriglobia bacterium]